VEKERICDAGSTSVLQNEHIREDESHLKEFEEASMPLRL
jgi:hypothetical protein